jgi:hypothetical protein
MTGAVTNQQGGVVGGARLTIETSLLRFLSVETDATGRYAIDLPSSAFPRSMRTEVDAGGYDSYWRDVNVPAASSVVENFRLHQLLRIVAGDSVVVAVTPDNGSCGSDALFDPCARLRVTVPVEGNLTITAVVTQGSAPGPRFEVCCLNSSVLYGNPVTLRVAAGVETSIEIGQSLPGVSTGETVLVTTSLSPF